MKPIADKVSKLLPEMEKRGAIYLFALFERDDVVGKWDVVISSEWSDRDAASAVRMISGLLVPTLSLTEITTLSRIVVIPSMEPSVLALTSSMGVGGGLAEIVDCNFMGLQIKHAFLFKSQKPSGEQMIKPVEALASGMGV